ncbi:PadR family transcriptional regulator [Brucella pituitosa]|uniref:PadR family transcriptional regulator n=1 Tax=Brucella pituitosa TaxID=571256 RepID=UPI0013747276|nr:PadR family transcriptional regulator [Brucella pituitosa]
MNPKASSSFRHGISPLLVLTLISQREMNGYQIMEALRLHNNSTVSIGEGIIYPVLHALEQGEFLRARCRNINGRSRICYSITSTGKRHLSNLPTYWSWNVNIIPMLTLGENNGQPA